MMNNQPAQSEIGKNRHEFSLRLKFFSLRMGSASYSELSRRNEANMGRRVWNVSCRDVGPLLEAYPRRGT
jgi:hypothetical protein